MNYYGKIEEADTLIGNMGVGVDYYKGETGAQGIPGKDGKDGKTPIKGVDYYTDEEIDAIKDEIAQKVQVGAKGEDGKSAYQIAVDEGFDGSEADWLASLKGADGRNGIDGINGTNGKDGTNGIDGKTPVKGVDYFTAAEIEAIEQGAADKVDTAGYVKSADLSTVATSGSYEDLKNKPNIPDVYELPVASATTLGGVKVGSGLDITNGVLSATGGGVADAVDWSKVQNKPEFADVATSGDYNDLSNKPAIPSVEGLASEAYVNEKVAAIVIPEVPTKVSELENDKGYLTEHQSLAEYAKKTEIPTVPTNVSAFTNDAGYLTEHQSLADYALKSEIPSTTNLATKAEVQEVENKIPAPYSLPTASTSTLGGVKVDGNTITITDGVISAKGGSGGAEPNAYIKDASVSGNTLTLTKKDDTEVVFTPSGGSSGGVSGYYFDPTATLTNDDKSHIIEIWNNKNIPMFIGQYSVIRMFMAAGYMYFCVLSPNGSVSNEILVYTLQVTNAAELKITSDKFIINQSYSLLTNTDGGNILTSNNWQNYISIGGSGDWNYTNDIWDSNLYNAKELIFVMGNSGSNMVDSVQCYYNFSKDSAGGETTLGGSFTNCRYYLKTESGNIYWEYTGSVMNVYNNSASYYFLYKT